MELVIKMKRDMIQRKKKRIVRKMKMKKSRVVNAANKKAHMI